MDDTSVPMSLAYFERCCDPLLSATLACCPTCMSYGAQLLDDDRSRCRSLCPTCQMTSVEWALALAIDELTRELFAFSRLDDALLTPLAA